MGICWPLLKVSEDPFKQKKNMLKNVKVLLQKYFYNFSFNALRPTFFNILKRRTLRSEQFLATESPLKTMGNAFYFTEKAVFVLKIFKFLSWLFVYVAKRLDKKDKVNFIYCDVTIWLTNNRNTHIVQYFKKKRKSDNGIWSIDRT